MRPLALVVENDSGTRKLLDVLLTRFGCEVDVVANGHDALQLLASVDYDLVLVDLLIPGATGLEILNRLREERPGALDRAIVLSSSSPKRIAEVQETYPQVRIIRKPFELQDVMDAAQVARRTGEQRVLPVTTQFERRSITAGAKAGLLVRKDGSEISLVHEFGYGGAAARKWFPMSPNDPFPLNMSVRDGHPRWLASLAMAAPDYPALAPLWQQNQSRALASVPLKRNGVVIGAAAWSFRETHPFDEQEQRAFTAIAEDAIAAIETRESAAVADT
jgi:CheY-like chemotaxis protein